MTRYLLSVHTVEGEARDPMTDEEMQQSYKEVLLIEEEMKSAGAWVFSGRLHEPDTATVVRQSRPSGETAGSESHASSSVICTVVPVAGSTANRS
jgi:hypothetical protein